MTTEKDSIPLVLIVDDNEDNLRYIGKTINDLDVNIALASSAYEAIDVVDSHIPELIVLDIVMPGMDGFELCAKLKDIVQTKNVPIIFLSAKNDNETVIKCFEMGARDYITKPFTREELIARIQTQLELIAKECSLKKINSNLEGMVQQRTQELKDSNKKLLDYNTALEVLLEKREKDKIEIAKEVLSNIDSLIIPLLQQIKNDDIEKIAINSIISTCIGNIEDIRTPLARTLKNNGLSSKEMTIANLIRDGKTTQEISVIFNCSDATVSYYRGKIRKKLGLKANEKNLQTHLNSLV